jgi:hypothetical protein
MKRCPTCGASLADLDVLRRQRNVARVMRWQINNRDRYNAYMRDYMRRYRKRLSQKLFGQQKAQGSG